MTCNELWPITQGIRLDAKGNSLNFMMFLLIMLQVRKTEIDDDHAPPATI